MPRILTDDEEFPPGWLRDSWNRDEALERRLERDRFCPAESLGGNPATHCEVCGRALEAQLTCIACGDSEEEAA